MLISLTNQRCKKSFALLGTGPFGAPEAPFRNVATPPFEGEFFVFANRPDPVVRRPAQAPPEKRSDARYRSVTLCLHSEISDPKKVLVCCQRFRESVVNAAF